MTTRQRISACCAIVSGFAVAASIRAQTPEFMSAQAINEPVVTGAPYTGEGITTVKLTMFDGTHIERSVTATFSRDTAGRIRREQTVVGLEALDPGKDWRAIVTIVDPVAGVIYTLVPATHTAHRLAMASVRGQQPPAAAAPAPVPSQSKEESLGTRDIDGLTAIGHRTVVTIPVGQVGNDRPIEISDERWESPDLKVLLMSRHHDPRSGDVEYRLTRISRVEPPRTLFVVPSGYTIMDQ
jgi:hypothetical protein